MSTLVVPRHTDPTLKQRSPLGRRVETAKAEKSSVTEMAYTLIQRALEDGRDPLNKAKYIDGLAANFNTHFEAVINEVEAVKAVNNVRLKVVNLPLDISVEFICGAYVFCIEIVTKIKTFPDLETIFASTGLDKPTQEALLKKFKESTNQLSVVTSPETSISTPFDDLAIELNKVGSFESKALLTAYVNLVKALINTLRLSLEAYIQH